MMTAAETAAFRRTGRRGWLRFFFETRLTLLALVRVLGHELNNSLTPITIQGDSDQLDQLLINLVSNAAEASLETGGGVCVGWKQAGSFLEMWVEDEGPGLANTANLFVPFFTTKAGGSGIGLVLCRQIAEAHGGQITLQNRGPDGGCVARLKLAIRTHPLVRGQNGIGG
jgi:signal transduction histidine kinase